MYEGKAREIARERILLKSSTMDGDAAEWIYAHIKFM